MGRNRVGQLQRWSMLLAAAWAQACTLPDVKVTTGEKRDDVTDERSSRAPDASDRDSQPDAAQPRISDAGALDAGSSRARPAADAATKPDADTAQDTAPATTEDAGQGGDDGDAGPPDIGPIDTIGASGSYRYSDAVTLDTSTQLRWQRKLPETYPQCTKQYDPAAGKVGDACFPDEARNYCGQLSLEGTGWRLPDSQELSQLVDESRSNPAIDVDAFPDTPSQWFCSDTSAFGNNAYGINFADGSGGLLTFEPGDEGLSMSNPTIHHLPGCRVRCVKGGNSATTSMDAGTTMPSCAEANGGCSAAASCADGGDGPQCTCTAGYMGDGVGDVGCQDVNECATSNGGCSNDMACINSHGSAAKCFCARDATTSNNDSCIPTVGTSGKYTFDDLTVTDTTTNLTWQRLVPDTYAPACTTNGFFVTGAAGSACRFAEATYYCSQLSLAGSGWRLPTREELMSIIDETRLPKIDPIAFPNTPLDGFWSSTLTENRMQVWFAYFNERSSSWTFPDGYGGLFVRCVR